MNFSLELPRELESAAAARHAVDKLSRELPEDVLGDVRLLVSELVTNSLRHAQIADEQSIALHVDVDDTAVRVEVSDPGKGFKVPDEPTDPEAVEGWGLYLVATLADRWGVDTSRETLVWFELDRERGGASAAA